MDNKAIKTRSNNLVWFLEKASLASIFLITCVVYIIKNPIPVRDAYIYCDAINEVIKTNDYSNLGDIPKLSVLLLSVPHRILCCDILKSGIVTNVLLGLLILFINVSLIERITGSKIASLCAGIVFSTYPSLIEFSCQILRENSYLFFLSLTLFFLNEYRMKNKKKMIVICGICIALATHCRYEAFEFTVIGSLFVCIFTKDMIRNRIRTLILYLASIAMTYISVECLFLGTFDPRAIYETIQQQISFKKNQDYLDVSW